jgi:hypothetical protein
MEPVAESVSLHRNERHKLTDFTLYRGRNRIYLCYKENETIFEAAAFKGLFTTNYAGAVIRFSAPEVIIQVDTRVLHFPHTRFTNSRILTSNLGLAVTYI